MVIECIRLKLTFSYGKLHANFGKFYFSNDGREFQKFTDKQNF